MNKGKHQRSGWRKHAMRKVTSSRCPVLLEQVRELHKLERLHGNTHVQLPCSRTAAEVRLKQLRALKVKDR